MRTHACAAPSQLAQAGSPAASRALDPRALLDDFGRLPCHLAAINSHHDLAHLLQPGLPFSSALGGDADLYFDGAPSLKLLAAAALRARQQETLAAAQATLGLLGGGDGDTTRDPVAAVACCKAAVAAAAATADGHRVHEACSVDAGACEAAALDADAGAGAPLRGKDVGFVMGRTAACGCGTLAPGGSGEAALVLRRGEDALTGGSCCSESGDSEDECCGVCLDALPVMRLQPCGHIMCSACCVGLFGMQHAEVVACPFCRSVVGCFRPACC
jgi:hypothetical protein